ncbi:CIA30 family protein [Citromicrobium bathyomarinum]|uniref:CIA30 family protein n=1 Tax=Citromicrobium bathyomarinum TaxID=72174 RepID=UPI003159AB5A
MSLAAIEPGTCRTLVDLTDPSEFARWDVINDGVMGGLSKGHIEQVDGALSFSGTINTNGGGFTSLRRMVPEGAMAGARRLRITYAADERTYEVTLRSDARERGRRIAYRAPLTPGESTGEWSVAVIDLARLETSLFGQQVDAPAFATQEAHSVGLIIADGIDGDFAMRLQRIEACA